MVECILCKVTKKIFCDSKKYGKGSLIDHSMTELIVMGKFLDTS